MRPPGLLLTLDNILEPALKIAFASEDREDTNPDCGADEDQEPEDDLLEGSHLRKVDGVETGFCHGGHDEEETVRIGDTEIGLRRSIKNHGCNQAHPDKIKIMKCDEV